MPTRHRVPTVFTLYMVDVFCCALGCVILLWLVSARDARRKANVAAASAKQAGEARLRLASAEGELTDLRAVRLLAERDGGRLRKLLLTTRQQRDELAQRAMTAEKQYAAARQQLAQARALLKGLGAEAAEARAGNAARAAEVAARLKAAEDRARDQERQAEALRQTAQDYRAQVAALESRARTLERDLERRATDSADSGKRLRELERRLAERGKDADDAHKHAAALQERARDLTQQLLAQRIEADRRFAGITLTGRRVVFLVDMSGSMGMRDLKTEDPEKWPKVRGVLARLVASLPELQQYQVILFSDRLQIPLGGAGNWLAYDGRTGPGRVRQRVQQVVPQGETDLGAALGEAFRYRARGLDTIYLLSDGLPNAGEGLPRETKGMAEATKAALLTRHVRRKLRDEWNRDLPGQPRVRINAIGFYFDSPDVGAFLWALAREHNGSFVGMSRP